MRSFYLHTLSDKSLAALGNISANRIGLRPQSNVSIARDPSAEQPVINVILAIITWLFTLLICTSLPCIMCYRPSAGYSFGFSQIKHSEMIIIQE